MVVGSYPVLLFGPSRDLHFLIRLKSSQGRAFSSFHCVIATWTQFYKSTPQVMSCELDQIREAFVILSNSWHALSTFFVLHIQFPVGCGCELALGENLSAAFKFSLLSPMK